ncbi:MAG: sugar transferase [Anaerolineae bacterium]
MKPRKRLLTRPLPILLVDLALTLLALWLADFLRHQIPFGREIAPNTVYLTPAVYAMVVIIWAGCFLFFGVYAGRRRPLGEEARSLLAALSTALMLFAGGLYFTRMRDFSRLLVVYFAMLDFFLLVLARWVRMLVLAHRHRRGEAWRTIIAGGGPTALEIGRRIQSHPWAGFELVGYAAGANASAAIANAGAPWLGDIQRLRELVQEHQADCVICTMPLRDAHPLADLALALQEQGVRVYLAPDYAGEIAFCPRVEDFYGISLIGVSDLRLTAWQSVLKRVLDIVISAVLLVLTAPLMAGIALAVRLDSPGPVLFRQPRVGQDGRIFTMYKFRTMVPDAEACLQELMRARGWEKPPLKIPDDPRVTRAGRLLRRLSLDELPQLWNVLRGDMSMVGPRPEEPRIVQTYNAWQRKRLLVKPGLTGPMQVNGRADLPMDDRVRLEIDYIQHYSLWEDLKIMAKTLPAIFSGKGSY